MDMKERDEVMRAKVREGLEQPFNPYIPPEVRGNLPPDERQTRALEYIAYQLGEIRRLLAEKK